MRCARIPATLRDGDPPQASILALWLDPAATRRVDALFQSDPAEAVVLDQAAGALLMAAVRNELARQGHNAGRNAEQADHVDQLAELVRRGCAPLPRLSPGQREQLTAAGLALANEDMPATRHALITVVPLTGCAACRLSGSCPTAGRS